MTQDRRAGLRFLDGKFPGKDQRSLGQGRNEGLAKAILGHGRGRKQVGDEESGAGLDSFIYVGRELLIFCRLFISDKKNLSIF